MGATRVENRVAPGSPQSRGRARRMPLVLASSSPQRRAILERLGVPFSVRPSGASELESGDPAALVEANALRKARAARRSGAREVVLACDTVVALDGVVYGKPPDERAAARTLLALSGTTHVVLSGLAVLLAGEEDHAAGEERTAIARTAVTFRALSEQLLAWYLATGEWRERAGGYAIQGAGAALVRAVDGDYENVVGLPLATLLDVYPELLER
jgi:septum formation protein